jgi:hypothetical protein
MVAKKNSEGNLDGRSEKAQTGMTGRCIEWYMSAESEEMEANGK